MYDINVDFFERFSVPFGKTECFLGETAYPQGYFAATYLNFDTSLLRKLKAAIGTFKTEFRTYMFERSYSAAVAAKQAQLEVWKLLLQMPVYEQVGSLEGANHLMRFFYDHPEETDDMLTPHTGRNEAMLRWLERLDALPGSIDLFLVRLEHLMENYFTESAYGERTASAYARIYDKHLRYEHMAIQVAQDDDFGTQDFFFEDVERKLFPPFLDVRITHEPVRHPKTDEFTLVERMEFEDLDTFLYMDFLRGMSVGHIPRRCQHCGRYFLLDSGYDTRYCTNIAPGETKKTCRQVGAHSKEKYLNGTVEIRAAYSKVYNRLKVRKGRRKISPDEWNAQVAQALEIKWQAEEGILSVAEWKVKFEAM